MIAPEWRITGNNIYIPLTYFNITAVTGPMFEIQVRFFSVFREVQFHIQGPGIDFKINAHLESYDLDSRTSFFHGVLDGRPNS